MTISVSLDIAGFYYFRHNIIVPDNATVRQVMDQARSLDLADYAAGKTTPVLHYTSSMDENEYMQSITVHHFEPAKSRQRRSGEPAREYAPGEYSFRSDGVKVTSPPVPYQPLTALDIAGAVINRPATVTWQYYIYDAVGVEEARRFQDKDTRVKVPFSKRDRSNMLSDGGTIVWRAVVIMIAPTRPKSIKATAAIM